MVADIIPFIPRPNPKADRGFWIGPWSAELVALEYSILNEIFPDHFKFDDTAPSEYVSPEKDPA